MQCKVVFYSSLMLHTTLQYLLWSLADAAAAAADDDDDDVSKRRFV